MDWLYRDPHPLAMALICVFCLLFITPLFLFAGMIGHEVEPRPQTVVVWVGFDEMQPEDTDND